MHCICATRNEQFGKRTVAVMPPSYRRVQGAVSPCSLDSGDGVTVTGDRGNAADETFDKKSSSKARESKRNKPFKSAGDIFERDAGAEKVMYEETQDRIKGKMASLNNALMRNLSKPK